LKIIHVLNYFLPYQTGGTEVYAWSLSKCLQELGFDVSILIPNYGSEVNDTYDYDGLTIVRYAEPSLPDRALIMGRKLPAGIKNFTAYLESQRPDIVHFHEIAGSNGISVAHFEAAKSTGTKVVFTMHLADNTCSTGTLMYKEKSPCDGIIDEIKCARCVLTRKTNSYIKTALLLPPSRLLFATGINPVSWQNSIGTALSVPFQIRQLKKRVKRIEASCDKIIPITKWYHNILLKNGIAANKMEVILQALPKEVGDSLSAKRPPALPLRIIFVGRLSKLKGIDLLTNVVKHFTAEQIQLDIYGSPTEKEFVQECKTHTASFKHIRWMGTVDQSDVVRIISDHDVLILPSTFSEMSPLVIQEAFAAGVPVIGSNVYGIAEQVTHNVNGWLFTFKNEASLKKQLQLLIDNPALIGKAKQHIPPTKSFKELAASYNKIYKEIVN
jgi:glycosyltransferase involved in cell wall biosynthesis